MYFVNVAENTTEYQRTHRFLHGNYTFCQRSQSLLIDSDDAESEDFSASQD